MPPRLAGSSLAATSGGIFLKTIIAITALATALASAGAASAEDTSAVMAPVDGFLQAFNTHAPLSPYFGPSQSVVDEFAPHHWTGPRAVRTWSAGWAAVCKAQGVTGEVGVRGAPTRIEQDARHAYVIVPIVFTYKVNGADGREDGVMSLALDHTTSGWKIAAFAWAGGKPTP